ncbi:MATE family efflux transporter [Ectobacillus polymachus]|uniref:MATE family efflux transporter n=1 Tax=Ectobacillus polymachus TaxID=1508806 RepID=UPI003A83E1FA
MRFTSNDKSVKENSLHVTLQNRFGLLMLAWPIFLDQFLKVVLVNVDTLMLSGYSDQAVAAVGVSSQIILVTTFIYGCIGIGSQIMIAQLVGAKNMKRIQDVISAALCLATWFGLVLSLVFLFASKWMLSLLGSSGTFLDYAQTFLVGVGSITLFVCLQSTIVAILRSYGYVKYAVLVPIIINLLNLFGNYLLIYGNLGFPKLGVTGVVISTTVSNVIGFVLAIILLKQLLGYRLRCKELLFGKKQEMKNILNIGIPSSGETFSYNASMLLVTVMVTFLGETELTTKIYVQNITQFVTLFSISIGGATQILIGFLIGAGDQTAAYKRAFKNLRIGLVFTAVSSTLLFLLSDPLMRLFTENQSIITLSKSIFLLTIILEIVRTINIIIIGSLNAALDVRFPVYVAIVVMWFISIPLTYFFGLHTSLGLKGIWLGLIADEGIRSALMLYRWSSGVWKRKSLVHVSPKNLSEIDRG